MKNGLSDGLSFLVYWMRRRVELYHILHDIEGFPVVATGLFPDEHFGSEYRQCPSHNFDERCKSLDFLLEVDHHFLPRTLLLLVVADLDEGVDGE